MMKSMMSNIVQKTMKRKLLNATITEEDIAELLKQIRFVLLDSDVSISVIKVFIAGIKEKCVDQIIDKNQNAEQFVLKVIKDQLIEILGKNKSDLVLDKKCTKIMLVGLQGSGKTTTVGKLAKYLKDKKEKNPLVVACDIYRPAAIDQLQTLANEIKVDFLEKGTQDPVLTIKESLEIAKNNNNDVIIIDTAGRLQTDDKMMNELVQIKNKFEPNEILLVVDAMSGQDIINVAKEFHSKLKLTGVIITKLDSDAKAGAALSIASTLNLPFKFLGTGERLGSLDIFYPNRMADRILGLGDIITLVEKAADIIDENRLKGQIQRMMSGKMDLEDLMNQFSQMNKMGSLGSMASMLPGLNTLSDTKIALIETKMIDWKVLISSMTLKERRNPRLFKKNPNRKVRVVKGSGKKPDDLNKLLRQWEDGNKKMLDIGNMIKRGKNPFGKNF